MTAVSVSEDDAPQATSPAPESPPHTLAPQPVPPITTPLEPDRLIPRSLPTGTGRILAAAAAMAAATIAATVTGAIADWRILASLTGGPLLLVVAVVSGMRARGIAVSALLSLGLVAAWLVAPAFTSTLAPFVSVIAPLVVIVIATIALWAVPDARSLGQGLVIGGFAGLAALAWPLPVAYGSYLLLQQTSTDVASAAGATALATWALATMGRDMVLNVGVTATLLRDALFRVLSLAAIVAASLWAGSTVEAAASPVVIGTAFESLVSTASWTFTIALAGALGWIALTLPGRLSRAGLRGRVTAGAIGEPLLFATCACTAAFVAWRLDNTLSLGRACWIALAGAAGYGACRFLFANPRPLRNVPLWIVVSSGDAEVLEPAAATVATAWKAGQVTILARPALAQKFGGEHLHAADRAGHGDLLFPQRLVHLEDWDKAQPVEWPALRIRELYATSALSPKILTERVVPGALVLVLAEAPEPEVEEQEEHEEPTEARWPFQVILDRWRRFIRSASRPKPEARVQGFFSPRAIESIASIAADRRLSGDMVSGQEAVVARVRALQPAPEPLVTRHVIVQAAPDDVAMAKEIAALVHGKRDSSGRIVECWVPDAEIREGSLRRLVSMPAGVWRHAMLFVSQLLEMSAENQLMRMVFGLVQNLLDRNWHGEFEIVMLEGPSGQAAPGFSAQLVERGLQHRIISRVISVRASRFALSYPSSLYAGQIRLPGGRTDAAYVAGKLLSLDFLTIEPNTPQATAGPPRAIRPRRLNLAVAIGAVVLAGAIGTTWYVRSRQAPESSSSHDSWDVAYQLRESGNPQGAIRVLDAAIPAASGTLRLQMLRDRAYCYKLAGQWTESIADLTAVLAGDASDSRTRSDRAYAYQRLRDFDAAIADYDASADGQARGAANTLRALLKARSGRLFVFLPVGATNDPSALPIPALSLEKIAFINLRFWDEPLAPDEVRYTTPGDATLAQMVTKALLQAGAKVAGPTLMPSNFPRPPRVEVWLRSRRAAAGK